MIRYETTCADRVGAMIRRERLLKKWSQQMLATKSGVGMNFVAQLEHGKETVQLDCVVKVLEALDMKVQIP